MALAILRRICAVRVAGCVPTARASHLRGSDIGHARDIVRSLLCASGSAGNSRRDWTDAAARAALIVGLITIAELPRLAVEAKTFDNAI
jgi:hypothetical protein